MNNKKIYLDDIRTPSNDDFIILRSHEEAVEYVKNNGIPQYISFDHDLGCDEKGNIFPSGFDFAKYLVDMDIENKYCFLDDFQFNVHSANPIGKKNIESLLNNYLSFKSKRR